MPHVELAHEGQVGLGPFGVGQLLGREVAELALHGAEYLGDGVRPFGPFTKHILVAGLCVELAACYASALLTAVVLFLHHQIELVEGIHPRAVLLLVVV